MGPERHSPNGNGWRSWLLSFLVVITIGLSSLAWSGHERRLGKIEDDGAVPTSVYERLRAVEEQEKSTHELLEQMTRQLDRIEQRQLNQASQLGRDRRP